MTGRHVGILAHSVPGAAHCFQAIARYGGQSGDHPDITMDCIAMERSMPAWEAGEHEPIRRTLAESVDRLARAGADFFVCPDNTAHIALEQPGPPLALPGLHIAREVAQHAAQAGYGMVGVLGTKWTMAAELYPRALAAHGIKSQAPAPDDRAVIQRITFDELVKGVFTDAARSQFVEVITKLADAGCDAVALVCTEHPLLVTPDVSPLPTLDSTDLLARAAVRTALGGELPTWRGGAMP